MVNEMSVFTVGRRRLIFLSGGLLLVVSTTHQGSARVITIDYTGTVAVALPGQTALPAGVHDGSAVVGSLSFDTADAVEAYAVGNTVPYTFVTGLTENVSIGADSWASSGGQVVLAYSPPPSYLGCGGGGCGSYKSTPGKYMFIVDSGVSGLGSNISINYTAEAPGIFHQGIGGGIDQNFSLQDAEGASGTIADITELMPFNYYINYNINLVRPSSVKSDSDDPTIPEPDSVILFCTGLAVLAISKFYYDKMVVGYNRTSEPLELRLASARSISGTSAGAVNSPPSTISARLSQATSSASSPGTPAPDSHFPTTATSV